MSEQKTLINLTYMDRGVQDEISFSQMIDKQITEDHNIKHIIKNINNYENFDAVILVSLMNNLNHKHDTIFLHNHTCLKKN